MKEWKKYFKNLLTEDQDQFKYRYNITAEDLENIKLEVMKSSGLEGTSIGLVKHGPGKLHQKLLQLFHSCLTGEDISQKWQTPHLTTIHKKAQRINQITTGQLLLYQLQAD
jgi:hypothetical protein